MGHKNEEVEAVLAELDRFGLKGIVGERGKHLEIAWTYPDGRRHFQIVARTASDHRAALNARGDVRRQLRADNIMPPLRPALSLSRALELPKPTDFGATRLAKLEKDVEGLLDLVVDLTAALRATEARLASVRVMVSFDAPTEKVGAAVERRASVSPGSRSDLLLAELNGVWRSRQDLAERTGIPVKNLSAALQYWKAKGVVENGQRGMWRRVPEVQVAEG